jgi:D-3-phosphoglycerate dehydrogenase
MTGQRRVVVVDRGYETYAAEEALLAEAGYVLELFEGDRHDTAAKLALARGAAGAFVRWTAIDANALDAIPTVKALVRYGVGYDNIDLEAATRRGVAVANVQGYANHAVSDHALALLLACVRGLRSAAEALRPRYTLPPRTPVPELRHMTLGIVGLGRIGGTLCTKVRPLVRRVLASDPYISPERFTRLGAEPCGLDRLLARSDVVTLHCNLTAETRLLIGRQALAHMRPTAILINTSRGPTVDEEALLEALTQGRILAAGLDVFWDEPPGADRSDLLAHPNVVATGHYAWYSEGAMAELQERAARNMVALLRGAAPEDCLNPEVFPR